MDWKRANLDICKGLANSDIVRAQKTDGDEILVIPNPAYYGYLFDPKDMVFSMSKVQMLPATANKIFDRSVIAPENEIKATNILRLIEWKKTMVRKFVADGKTTWVDTKLLKYINVNECKFYQPENELSAIIVVDNCTPVMCVLPMRMTEEEE